MPVPTSTFPHARRHLPCSEGGRSGAHRLPAAHARREPGDVPRIETYRWIDYQGLSVLAIYRGDVHLSPSAPRECILARTEPLWAFVDFDPAGLVIANALPPDRLQRLVLPDPAWLAEAATTSAGRSLYGAQEAKSRGALAKSFNPEIKRSWLDFQRLKGAVTQERMRSAPAP